MYEPPIIALVLAVLRLIFSMPSKIISEPFLVSSKKFSKDVTILLINPLIILLLLKLNVSLLKNLLFFSTVFSSTLPTINIQSIVTKPDNLFLLLFSSICFRNVDSIRLLITGILGTFILEPSSITS